MPDWTAGAELPGIPNGYPRGKLKAVEPVMLISVFDLVAFGRCTARWEIGCLVLDRYDWHPQLLSDSFLRYVVGPSQLVTRWAISRTGKPLVRLPADCYIGHAMDPHPALCGSIRDRGNVNSKCRDHVTRARLFASRL